MSNKKEQSIVGGLSAVNAGKIEDCYSFTSIDGNGLCAGLIASNTEFVKNSYYFGKISKKGEDSSLYAENSGDIFGSFAITSDSYKNNSFEENEYSCSPSDVYNRLIDNGWDLENIWKASEGTVPKFREETWWADFSYDGEPIHIYTSEQLTQIADKIENGDRQAASAIYILDEDIDFKGKKWTPIGTDILPFTGILDGNGHEIKNFKVKASKNSVAGLFGYLNGVVINLGVDGIITGGNVSGGVAAVTSKDAIVACCYSKCSISSSQVSGGLVGKNFGSILRSFSAGQVKKMFPWHIFLSSLAVILAIVLLLLWIFRPGFYPNVPVDQGANKVEQADPVSGTNHVSYQFTDQAVFPSSTENGQFYIKNPGDSNHNIVVEIYITDQELLNTVGTTGRSAQEQKALEAAGDYSPETQRTLVAESGSIPPGYELDVLTLKSLPDGTTLTAGTYAAIAQLVFYDINTNECAMVNSELPISLVIES